MSTNVNKIQAFGAWSLFAFASHLLLAGTAGAWTPQGGNPSTVDIVHNRAMPPRLRSWAMVTLTLTLNPNANPKP